MSIGRSRRIVRTESSSDPLLELVDDPIDNDSEMRTIKRMKNMKRTKMMI
jgi:hypothetical protein